MPDFDFDAYNHDNVPENEGYQETNVTEDEEDVAVRHTPATPVASAHSAISGSHNSVSSSVSGSASPTAATGEEVDKW